MYKIVFDRAIAEKAKQTANQKRSDAFEKAAKVYCESKGVDFSEEGLRETLINFLTDALHFANQTNQAVDLSEIVELSSDHFHQEKYEAD